MRHVTLLIVAAFSLLAAVAAKAQTPFTYQGELSSDGTLATGTYDFRFRLFDARENGSQFGSTLCSDNLSISAGRFTVTLDFGLGIFDGGNRFLEIEVRSDAGLGCADDTDFTILSRRQELTAVPNASFAQNAATATTAITANFAQNAATATNATSLNGQSPSFYQNAANLTGTLPDTRLSTNVARLNSNQTFTGLLNFTNPGNTFTGNGAGLTNINGANIAAGTIARSSLSADVQSGLGTPVPDASFAGSVATGTGPISVAVSGSFAYVVNEGSNTLQVFNISNPATPTLAGSVATGGGPRGVAVSGSFAYVVSTISNFLGVFNVSNPAAPTFVGAVATASGPTSVAVSGSFAYVARSSSHTLQVFNISNPAAPTLAGSVATGFTPRAVAGSGSFAYVVNSASNTLQIFNMSNPATPTLAGSVATGLEPISVAVAGSFAYVVNFDSNTLQVFDISNPATPALAGSAATGLEPISVAVSGSSVYVANKRSNTLQVFNIVNPALPTLTATVPTSLSPSAVAASGSAACVTNISLASLDVFKIMSGVGFGAPLASSSLTGVNASALTSLNASNITTGTLADSRLSSNIALKNAANAFTSTGVTSFAGNVGIGTTTPSSQFSLQAVSAGATQIALTGGPATGGAIPPRTWSIQSSDVNGPLNQITGSFQIVDRTAIASRLLIDTNGNVGIGTTAPSQRLTVAGNMNVTGSIAKGGGSFKIDHPLDPENKYLYHSFVESPDMMNIYNGEATTDAAGYAVITLPEYFQALNRDFRYQLTVIDDDDQTDVIVWAKVVRRIGAEAANTFTIRTFRPNVTVSWQVTGVRKDAWAEKNRIPNTVDKPAAEKGTSLHPEAFDKPATQRVYSPAAQTLSPGK